MFFKKNNNVINYNDPTQIKSIGNGIINNGEKVVTHTSLNHAHMAVKTLHAKQKIFLVTALLLVILSIILFPIATIKYFIAFIVSIYIADLLFTLYLTLHALSSTPEIKITKEEFATLDDALLPTYTIFCPLYKEWQVIPQFVNSIAKLDWPKDKLDVQLLLEEDDVETIEEIKKIELPPYFSVFIVPHAEPKTKPKACNYGLNYAKGDFSVIYDAEDMPEEKQLKKAYLAFKRMESQGKDIMCIQAKLNFYNAHQNMLTRLFTMEYSLWFSLILPGLQSIDAPIPLGGTSNHFRTKDLDKLQGWDPFNVTEDCDLGMRIAKLGYRTSVLDSFTLEEANSHWGNWIRQRSRWIKGYMQTYLVHMRNPLDFIYSSSLKNFAFFQLTVGAKIISLFVNPLLWTLTVVYFAFPNIMKPLVEQLYFAPVYYFAITSFVIGNAIYIYNYMIGAIRQKNYSLVPFAFLMPLYWVMISIAAWKAFVQLIFKPHYWEKTIHGLHLNETQEKK